MPNVTPAAEWSEVTDWRLLEAHKDANNWLTYYRTYNGWRYSPLSQINAQTVKRLTPKWMLSLGEAGNQQATPLVNDGMMIITSPLGLQLNRVYAVDVASGRVLWKHEHKLPEELPGLVRLIPMNRGVALYKDKGLLRHARRSPGGTAGGDRRGGLEDEGGRRHGWLLLHHGAARHQGQDHRR